MRWHLAAAAVVACAAAFAGSVVNSAQAQLGVDTEFTPEAKSNSAPARQWTVLGGAEYGGEELVEFSETPATVDFFTTSFSPAYVGDPNAADPLLQQENPEGFFGGAECIEEVEPTDEALEICARRPAIYRYYLDAVGDPQIDKVPTEQLTGPGEEGYVGAISWLDGERALAVGGTLTYPRREPDAVTEAEIEPGESLDEAYARKDAEQGAGMARVWLYDDDDGDGVDEAEDADGISHWRELENLEDPSEGYTGEDGDEIPDAMRAPTALDCVPANRMEFNDGSGRLLVPKDTCVAGALQQLWWWRPAGPERPDEGFDPDPVTGGLGAELPDFHYRVRQLRFDPDPRWTGSRIWGVTSGCCADPSVAAESGASGVQGMVGARLLTHSGDPNAWHGSGAQWHTAWTSASLSPLAAEDATAADAPLPDSYYAFIQRCGGCTPSAIVSPGGAHRGESEPGSRIVAPNTFLIYNSSHDLPAQRLDELRLLAADGDFAATEPAYKNYVDVLGPVADDLPDWAVGSFKMSDQGIAYTTVPSILPLPTPFTCSLIEAQNGCDVDPRNVTDHRFDTSKRLVELPTYALNALSFVPGTQGGLGWAAGDRGALVRLGGEGGIGAAAEPDAPALLVGPATPLSERGPFDPFRAGLGQDGVVPALAGRPLEQLPEKTLVPWGTPDASRLCGLCGGRRTERPTAIAMSRDGSEGWAVGAGAPHYFDGERWARCDPSGLAGAYEPDRACASLASRFADEPPQLIAIARIPFERDDDPTNDDEFEAIAVIAGGAVLRYREGRWEPDVDANIGHTGNPPTAQIVFRTPGDGWALTGGSLNHYGGGEWPDGEWEQCPNGGCGDSDRLLPTGLSIEPRGSISHLRVAGDTVFVAGTRLVGGSGGSGVRYPFVLSKTWDPETGDGDWVQDYDPGCPPPSKPPNCAAPEDPEAAGFGSALSVVDLGDGRIAGWLLGRFGGANDVPFVTTDERTRPLVGPDHVLIRRDPDWDRDSAEPGSGPWAFREVDDAAEDLIPFAGGGGELLSVRGPDGEERSFLAPASSAEEGAPPLEYDPVRDRWGVLRAPFVSSSNFSASAETQGRIVTAAPDEQGGIWVAALSSQSGEGPPGTSLQPSSHQATFYYRYTDQRRTEVFEDAPSPIAEQITGMAGTPDGEVWVSTESDRLYHYDRIGGWESVRINGWDRGRVVTRPSKALAVAVNDAGIGIAVGAEGRIADLSPDGVALNPASGRRCSDVPPPCGTPRALSAAAVAPDGSAIAGGDNLTLMARPAGGHFQTIEAPRVASGTRVTGVSMPVPGRAWITLEQGEIWAGTGELVGERWRWRWTRESDSEAARDEFGLSRLYAIEVQSDGRGLAVGWGGAVLERSPDGTWRRIKTGFVDSLHAIAFPPSGYGDGTIVGGDMGEILTRIDGRYQLARQTDFADPLATATNNVLSGKIVGLALSGGSGDGDVEAWAASQVSGGRMRQPLPWALLHYGSGDPLLDPESRAGALPDAPAPEPGGLTLAAFGRSECQLGGCPPFQGTNLFNEVISRGIRAELTERRERTGEVLAAAFTGEISSSPGRQDRRNRATHTPDDANISHDQWRELAANPLLGDGIAVFGTPGERDLSGAEYCDGAFGCRGTRDHAPTGPTSQWRESFSTMPAPWGSGEPYSADGYEYRPVEGSLPKVDASSATGEQSANTHYAVDVVREEDDEPMARLVFADTSSAHSLAASDANQNPVEPQEAWLEEVLCQEGSAADTAALDCTRPAGLPAVVVTTTPTYSYGPGAIDGTQTEAASFESLLLRHEVTALVTGHLGWNGLYYTCAPGLHTPTPGGEHPAGPPGSAAECGGAAPGQTGELEPPDPSELSSDAGATGVLPTAIASSAGGRFGPTGNDEGGAADGFWHGYSVIRIPSDGDPRKVIVEQRPILDWIGITARDHVVGPRQRMTLEGYGREPLGTDTSVRMLEIDSHAITHRYDLLLADPDQPWLPCEESDTACTTLHANLSKGEASEENPCAPYLCLPRRIGTVDETTGLVRSGDGRYPETFALGMLSVGSKAATWPLVFERSPSFVTRSALRAPGAPQLNNVPTPGAPGQLPPPEVPQIPKIEVPAIPPPPAIPSLSATAPPEPTPPTPPAPPPPSQQPAPLDLSVAPPGVSISTPTALIQPPTPPVNPAPPGGARREARQRQAAAQKGGADNDASEGAEETQNAGGDKAMAPDQAMTRHESAMTRRAPTRAEPSFTTLAASDQPSAWSRGAFYGGGFLLVSATLALGFSTLRPTPRRRPPEVPAPATATYRWRRPRG